MLLDGLLKSNHTLSNCHRVSQVLQSVGQLISAVLSWPAVEGVLKGYDQLLNLVLDETVEYSRGSLLFQAEQSAYICDM